MFKHHAISFLVSFLVGLSLNAMNLLAFRLDHLYLSLTLVYGGLLMASHMIWSHQMVNYLTTGRFDLTQFIIGVTLAVVITVVMRAQIGVDDNQYLKRMISHHSTALTTSHKIAQRSRNPKVVKLANDIIATQEREIAEMKAMIKGGSMPP